MAVEINIDEITIRCLESSRAYKVQKRMHEKIDDYSEYAFSPIQSSALNVFFDLAQEFESFHDLLGVCVLIPKVFFDLDCNLFLILENRVEKVSTCEKSCPLPYPAQTESLEVCSEPMVENDVLYLPIKGKQELLDQLPYSLPKGLIGMLEIYPARETTEHDRLFFEKYANRVGFQLHMRMIGWKNEEHLQFINTLVKDIGHNVIVPNMFFKIFYRRLEAHIKALGELVQEMKQKEQTNWEELGTSRMEMDSREINPRLEYIYSGLREQYNEILNHYEQTSLFLETLLRRSHFEQGKYVLEKRCATSRARS